MEAFFLCIKKVSVNLNNPLKSFVNLDLEISFIFFIGHLWYIFFYANFHLA